jgi:hypothetical protein
MCKVLIIVICGVYLCFSTLTVTAQKTKNIMTNADVIEMVKAKLPEDTIILAIQQSEPNFDTSTKALIDLKNEGVSQKILETMLQSQSKQSVPQNKTDNVAGNAESGSLKEFVLIDGENRISMKYSVAKAKIPLSGVLNPFGGKTYYTLNGNRAQLRINNPAPEFELSLPSNMKASEQITLYRLKVTSDSRDLKTGKIAAIGKDSGKSNKEAFVPAKFEEIKTESMGGMKYTLYRVKVVGQLPPGEYALVTNYYWYYDFGIDIGK